MVWCVTALGCICDEALHTALPTPMEEHNRRENSALRRISHAGMLTDSRLLTPALLLLHTSVAAACHFNTFNKTRMLLNEYLDALK